MKLIIATPYGEKFNGEVSEITAPDIMGEIDILPGHAPLVTAIDIGEIKCETAEGTRFFAINKGYLEIADDIIDVVAETCESEQEIDVERAQNALTKAQKNLDTINPDDLSRIATMQDRIKRAQFRISVAAKNKR